MSKAPTLRGLPVAAPYSPPAFLRASASSPDISTVNGPSPTQVEYAFIMPRVPVSASPGTPAPIGANEARVVDEEVYGYIPKSISLKAPSCASNIIFLPSAAA